MDEGQTNNGQKKKGQKDKQRSTKHAHNTKDRLTGTPLKTGGEIRCSGRVSSSSSTSGTRGVHLSIERLGEFSNLFKFNILSHVCCNEESVIFYFRFMYETQRPRIQIRLLVIHYVRC